MRLYLILLAVVALASGVLNGCNSAEKNAKSTPIAPANAQTPADGARRVTVAELKDLLDKDQAVVIDVRNEASYNAGHVRGAKLIPEAEIVNHLDELPRNKLIVTYCS